MQNPPSESVYFGDLHPDVTDQILYEICIQAGPVQSVHVAMDDGVSKGFGFCKYKDLVSGCYAVALFRDCVTLFGRTLRVGFAKERSASTETEHSKPQVQALLAALQSITRNNPETKSTYGSNSDNMTRSSSYREPHRANQYEVQRQQPQMYWQDGTVHNGQFDNQQYNVQLYNQAPNTPIQYISDHQNYQPIQAQGSFDYMQPIQQSASFPQFTTPLAAGQGLPQNQFAQNTVFVQQPQQLDSAYSAQNIVQLNNLSSSGTSQGGSQLSWPLSQGHPGMQGTAAATQQRGIQYTVPAPNHIYQNNGTNPYGHS